MKVLYCGYRRWSIDAFVRLQNLYTHIDFTIIKTDEEFNSISDKYDITLLVGWSSLISKEYVDNNFTVVVHPSDLPEYAGGSPIQNQIIDGLDTTKATLFRATSELDKGPIIAKCDLDLRGSLDIIFHRLSYASVELIQTLLETFPNHNEVTQTSGYIKCTRRTPKMSEITIEELQNHSCKQLYDKIRCLTDPYPNAFIKTKDGKLYITGARYEKDDNLPTC